MKITVTQEHINSGKRNMARSCPVALAIKAGTRKRNVRVGNWFIYLTSGYIPTPASVQRFIYTFDNNKSVKPFTFELEGV